MQVGAAQVRARLDTAKDANAARKGEQLTAMSICADALITFALRYADDARRLRGRRVGLLAHPASVDSIPTSAGQEDHVSMGTIAIRQSREILANVEYIIAIELMCAAQAYDLVTEKTPLKAGKGTRAAYKVIREHVPFFEKDRDLYKDIEAITALVRDGQIIRAVEDAAGEIKGWAARW